jgi:hypothetical protein
MENIQKMLDENVVLPLWPTTGKILGLSRNSTYARAEDGDIATIRLGRLRKVPTAWLRQKLGLELLSQFECVNGKTWEHLI